MPPETLGCRMRFPQVSCAEPDWIFAIDNSYTIARLEEAFQVNSSYKTTENTYSNNKLFENPLTRNIEPDVVATFSKLDIPSQLYWEVFHLYSWDQSQSCQVNKR